MLIIQRLWAASRQQIVPLMENTMRVIVESTGTVFMPANSVEPVVDQQKIDRIGANDEIGQLGNAARVAARREKSCPPESLASRI